MTERRIRDHCALGDAAGLNGEPVLSLLAAGVALTRDRFIDALVSRGFRLEGNAPMGTMSETVLQGDDLSIELDKHFPFLPPRVQSRRPEVMSWHRDELGYFCLYTPLDHEHRPWLDADAFLERIAIWRHENERGWSDDPPALDLEPYLHLALDSRFVLYRNLDNLSNKFVIFSQDNGQLRLSRAGRPPKGRRRRHLSGYVLDVGELRRPPATWLELLDGHQAQATVAKEIEADRLDILLVRYERQGQRATAAITFAPQSAVSRPLAQGRRPHTDRPRGVRQAYVARSSATGDDAMRLRSGKAASHLGSQRVCVVGAGALGSFVCDSLVRAGIGKLTIRDFDVMRPGNMTRHVVGDLAYAGLNKAVALQTLFATTAYSRAEVDAQPYGLLTVEDALTLIRDHDLVVDASADGAATAVLRSAAEASGTAVVVVCLLNEGRSLRVDIVPPLDGADALAATPLQPSTGPEMFDGGCGLPLSLTPPQAVQEAAAIAVRHAIALLASAPLTLAGEVREL